MKISRQLKWMTWLIVAIVCMKGTLQAGVIENFFNMWWKSDKDAPPTVKVLVAHDQPGNIVEVKGKYKIFDPHTNGYISTRFIGKRKFLQPLKDGLKWGEEFPGIYQLKIIPDDAKTTTLVDGIEYKGIIYIYDIGGTVSIVNEVALEDYLKTLLTPQFDQKISNEVAAAIAITARTNAWFQAKNSSNPYWSIEADRVGYQGSAAGARNIGIAHAIRDTHGMVMTKEGTLFSAEWGSAAGGSVGAMKPTFSRITLFDAEHLAQKGEHAAQILSQAFPGSTVTLIEKLE